MKCQVCDKRFHSFEWYESDIKDLMICDECVLEVYKMRKSVRLSEIESIDRKIKELECKTEGKVTSL